MPYTLAHPAVVLPLRRLVFLSPVGLVLGALSPDFEHMLRFNVISLWSHSLSGLFWFCVPLGLAAVYVYRVLWIHALQSYFPFLKLENTTLFKEILSVFIGASSHLLWDSFTHKGRWAVDYFQVLQNNISLTSELSLPAWHVLQHASSIIGLVVIVFFVFRASMLRHQGWLRNYGLKFIRDAMLISLASILFTLFVWSDVSIKSQVVLCANTILNITVLFLSFKGLHLKYCLLSKDGV